MKILVLGNSQVAALRLALVDVLPEGRVGPARRGGHEYYFYAQFGGGGPNLYAREGRLAAPRVLTGSFTTIPGAKVEDGLSLDGFDAVVISAVGLRADRGDGRHLLSGVDLATLVTEPGPRSVSAGMFADMLHFETTEAPQWGTVRAIREIYAGPLLFQPWPLPVPSVLERDDFGSVRRYGARTGAFLAHYFAAMRAATAANAATLSPAADVLPLPDPRWAEAGFTPAEYGTRDPWHMNALYGAKVLDQIAAWAATLPPRAA